MITDYILDITPAKIAGAALLAVSIAVAGFAAGWTINGWKKSGELKTKDEHIAILTGELNRQGDAIIRAEAERQELQKKASEAQKAAIAAKKKTDSKIVYIHDLQASSCAGVMNELWGKL